MSQSTGSTFDAQEMIQKARELSEKLRLHNNMATELFLKGRSIEKREEAVDELHTILRTHNSVPFLSVTRANVIQDLHQEQRVLQALRQENHELSQAVQENGDAVQYIMKKYHQHSKKLNDLRKNEAMCPMVVDKILGVVVNQHIDAFHGAIAVAQDFVSVEDENAKKREGVIESINKENKGLRTALNIMNKFCNHLSTVSTNCESQS